MHDIAESNFAPAQLDTITFSWAYNSLINHFLNYALWAFVRIKVIVSSAIGPLIRYRGVAMLFAVMWYMLEQTFIVLGVHFDRPIFSGNNIQRFIFYLFLHTEP